MIFQKIFYYIFSETYDLTAAESKTQRVTMSKWRLVFSQLCKSTADPRNFTTLQPQS